MVRLTSAQNTLLRSLSGIDRQIEGLINEQFRPSNSGTRIDPPAVVVDIPRERRRGNSDNVDAPGINNRDQILSDITAQNRRFGSDSRIDDLANSVQNATSDTDAARFIAQLRALYIQRELAIEVLSLTFDSQRQILALFR